MRPENHFAFPLKNGGRLSFCTSSQPWQDIEQETLCQKEACPFSYVQYLLLRSHPLDQESCLKNPWELKGFQIHVWRTHQYKGDIRVMFCRLRTKKAPWSRKKGRGYHRTVWMKVHKTTRKPDRSLWGRYKPTLHPSVSDIPSVIVNVKHGFTDTLNGNICPSLKKLCSWRTALSIGITPAKILLVACSLGLTTLLRNERSCSCSRTELLAVFTLNPPIPLCTPLSTPIWSPFVCLFFSNFFSTSRRLHWMWRTTSSPPTPHSLPSAGTSPSHPSVLKVSLASVSKEKSRVAQGWGGKIAIFLNDLLPGNLQELTMLKTNYLCRPVFLHLTHAYCLILHRLVL